MNKIVNIFHDFRHGPNTVAIRIYLKEYTLRVKLAVLVIRAGLAIAGGKSVVSFIEEKKDE